MTDARENTVDDPSETALSKTDNANAMIVKLREVVYPNSSLAKKWVTRIVSGYLVRHRFKVLNGRRNSGVGAVKVPLMWLAESGRYRLAPYCFVWSCRIIVIVSIAVTFGPKS